MKKVVFTIILISYTFYGIAQEIDTANTNKYPFNLNVLKGFSSDLDVYDTIMPVYHKGKYRFINSHTGANVTDSLFQEAYPFRGKYAIVKQNGKYGVVDKNIRFLIKPSYSSAEAFTQREHNWNNEVKNINTQFSFLKGAFVTDTSNYHLDEPIGPQIWFRKEGKKYYYELNDKNKTRSEAVYDTFYVVSPYFAIARKSGRYGAISFYNGSSIPFIYEKYIGPTEWASDYYQGFGFAFKKGTKWYCYGYNKKPIETRFEPYLMFKNVIIYKVGKEYNYLNRKGLKMLTDNYKWIYKSGNLAVSVNDEIVLFNNRKQPFVYYHSDKN